MQFQIEVLFTQFLCFFIFSTTEMSVRFFEAAMNEAQKSTMKNLHGCVIVIGGKIVSSGHNTERTTIRNQTCCSVHAEMCALSRLLRGRLQCGEKPFTQQAVQEKQKEGSQDQSCRFVCCSTWQQSQGVSSLCALYGRHQDLWN